jgi:hypothetical protein
MQNRIYYRCRLCEWSEDTFDDTNQSDLCGWSDNIMQQWHSESTAVRGFYTWAMIKITERVLTNQGDAEHAAAGFLRRASAMMKCEFLECLPTACFDLSLLFSPEGTGRRRRYNFPSYSWTGWIGQSYPFAQDFNTKDNNDWFLSHTWIIWYKRTKNGIVAPVWARSEDISESRTEQSLTCFRQSHPINLKERHSFEFSTAQTTPTMELYFDSLIPRYSLLQFWTLAVHLKIRQYMSGYRPRGYISDARGLYCGTVFFDSTEGLNSLLREQQTLEFIVLSERWAKEGNLWDYRETPIPFEKPPYLHSKLKNLYWVIAIQWRGGIAERKGIGSIWQEAVENSWSPGPMWKEIILG